MPVYLYKCECGTELEETLRMGLALRYTPACPECGHSMQRDYAKEKATHNFHPTKDLYATSLKQRRPRKE